MRTRLSLVAMATMCLASAALAAPVSQDAVMLRFAERAISWYPDSAFTITADERVVTAAGAYRLVRVDRSCASQHLSGPTDFLIDELTSTVFMGQKGNLPAEAASGDPNRVKAFVDSFLPKTIQQSMRQKVRVEWPSGERARGAVLRVDLQVETGYGEHLKPVVVTADGKYLMFGAEMPWGRDPVEYRRELLNRSGVVIWDHGSDQAKVEIVEFSDLQCPACKRKWALVKDAMATHGDSIRHGMVSFPLPAIHPWAFRAASATWCLARLDPSQVVPFKELFYSLQTDMTVSDVTPTAADFVVGQGLDEAAFRACNLRELSIDGVHREMALASALGIMATPTYVVNGWLVQMPDEPWFATMIQRLVAGRQL